MFKMKKIAAVAAAAVMAVSAMAVSVSAYSTSYTNRNYYDTLREQQDNGLYSVLSVYYLYGGSKADIICNYAYNNLSDDKYAVIQYNKKFYGDSDPGVDVNVKQTIKDLATAKGETVYYSGYCKSSSGTKYNNMYYTLELT